LYAERLRAQDDCRQAPARGAEALVTDGTNPPDAVSQPWRPARFMVIAAHPDDAEYGPAATAAKWIDEGSVGWLVCCTSGDQGGEDPAADPLELALLREDEQRAAAAIVGYEGVSFLNQPDGALANDLVLREHLVREIRTFRPDAVLATDPETIFYGNEGVNHVDHRAAGIAAVDAVYPAARNPMAFPWLAREGLASHNVRRLYLFWSNEPTVRVDVTDSIDRKIAALREHASQIKEPDKIDGWIRESAGEHGKRIGTAAAEGFRLIVIDEDADEAPPPESVESPDSD
jgi:LmbE family N-acetylglucosaminyl deacetylase